MSIILSIIESPENCTIVESSKTFGEQGGTIGRGTENYWVLNDPECFLSTYHSQISYENGVYMLTDLSTNGTFLNGSREPMGKGNQVQLQDGDEIVLSDYKFKINLWQSDTANQADPFPESFDNNNLNENQNFDYGDPFATGDLESIEPILNSAPIETDPLAALDNVQKNKNSLMDSMPFTSNQESYSDMSDVLTQQVEWPNSIPESGAIPEDWNNTEFNRVPPVKPALNPAPSAPPPQIDNQQLAQLQNKNIRLQEENSKLRKELNKLNQQFVMLQKRNHSSSNSTIDTTVINAMGLAKYNLDTEQITEINTIAGEMIRETIAGMMQVLTARSSIKNEFRMNVTTIQPVENNPLKFSANIDDALENMFLKKGSSYKKPIESIKDAFHGIAEHQVAILAGIRAAFNGSIERFEPYSLEKRFERKSSSSLDKIPMYKKAKNWEQFIFYYNDLVHDLDNSFQYLFGDDFVRAYEDQLQRLYNSRHTEL